MKLINKKIKKSTLLFLLTLFCLNRLLFAETQKVSNSKVKTIETKETEVDIQGKKFKKIELKSEKFFVEAYDSSQSNEEIRILCQNGSNEVIQTQAKAGTKVAKRTHLVIEGIRQVCKDASNGKKEITVDPSILLGLEIQLNQTQNKKIIVTPVGLTFKADW